jgi:hypothetical protein
LFRSAGRRERKASRYVEIESALAERDVYVKSLVALIGPGPFEDQNMKKPDASQDQSASALISKRVAELGGWRGETLSRMRTLIKKADPDVVEEWKWVKPTKPGTPVWSHDGIICTGESYKSVVKLTFARGASLKDPAGLFNSSLDGNVRRAIDIHEGEDVDEPAFKALVRQAVALNTSDKSEKSKKASQKTRMRSRSGA